MPPKGTINDVVKKDLWTPLHSSILMMHSEGVTTPQIAKQLGIKQYIIKDTFKRPEFIKNLETVRENVIQTVISQRTESLNNTAVKEARHIIENASKLASTVIVQIAKGELEPSRVQLDACKDILDRCGVKALVITETRERVYSTEEVTSAKKVLDEAQEIVARLSNNTSPFILGDSRNKE